MIRRLLQIVLLSLFCGGAALVLLAQAAETDQPPQEPARSEAPAPSTSPAPPPANDISGAQPAPDKAVEPPLPKVGAPTLEELLQPVNDLSSAIEAAEKQLEEAPGVQKELAALRTQIDKIQSRAKAAADALHPRLDEVRSQIAKLGEAPAAGAPPEAPEVAAERDRLNKLAAQIDGAIKKAALVEVRAAQLISRVQHVRQGVFTRFLFWQTQTPLQPEVWRSAADQLHQGARQIAFIAANWWSVAEFYWRGLLGVLAAALFAYAALRTLATRLGRSRLDAGAATPPLHERAGNAVWSAAAFAVPPAVAALVLYAGLDEAGLLYWQVERFAQSLLSAFLVFICISALARGVLQPRRPRWRLFDLADSSAATICLALQGIAAVHALDYLARRSIGILSLSPSADIVSAFVASLLYVILILVIVCTPFVGQPHAPGVPLSRWRPFWLKALLVALAALVLGAALLGFVTLARFIAGQVLMTGSGLVVVALAHFAIRGVGTASYAEREAKPLEAGLTLEELRRLRVARGLRLFLNVALVVLAVPVILMAWGIAGAEILSWMTAAVLGFDVGGMHISLVRIFAALILFAALLVATRLFQRWLAARALPRTRMDSGLANSIYTGAGYLGFAVAVLAAIAYAGFDITSLAIVAGALSVGIGFGLQGIVNNFVSGLILLVERPVKVGDWISIKEGEGYVRRIAVRATEIETFDRASLIVPNSELVTQTVTNLTHRNQLGRLNINVRISYAADPELAEAVLQKIANGNTSILRHPPPLVVLDNLGDQALEYSLRVYLADVNRSLQVQTELRTQIVKALRAAGIDIPYFAVQVGHASGPRLAPDRVAVRLAAALDSDPDAVLEALGAAAQGCPGALQEPPPEVAFDNVGEDGLEFSVSVATADRANARRVETALRSAAVKAMRAAGLQLAGAGAPHLMQRHHIDELRTPLTGSLETRVAPKREMPARECKTEGD